MAHHCKVVLIVGFREDVYTSDGTAGNNMID